VRRYLARRLLLLVPVLVGVSIVIFGVLHLSPGDPAEIMLGSQATKEDLVRLRESLGLNEPLPISTCTGWATSSGAISVARSG
jgi:peptide/nickel transport system permease protein